MNRRPTANLAGGDSIGASRQDRQVAIRIHPRCYAYAKEYHVERLWREARLLRNAPFSHEMVFNYIAGAEAAPRLLRNLDRSRFLSQRRSDEHVDVWKRSAENLFRLVGGYSIDTQ